MNDINEILRALLDRLSVASEVDRKFAQMLSESDTLKMEYETWCESNGYDEKTGYQDYVDELIEARDSIWENLKYE